MNAISFFTSVFSIAEHPRGPVGGDGAISRPRKTEVDFRRCRDRQAGVAAVAAGPIDSPPWRMGRRSAKGPVPDPNRPHNPHFPPTRPHTYRCYRDTQFWRYFFFRIDHDLSIKYHSLENSHPRVSLAN